jgi:hypothetical protein
MMLRSASLVTHYSLINVAHLHSGHPRNGQSPILLLLLSLFICSQALGKSDVKEQGEQVLRGEETIPAKRRGSTSN